MKERLRQWLLAKLLGRYAYTLFPMPVQVGDFVMLRPKNPGRTGYNTPQRVEVTKVDIRLAIEGRYRDGSISSFVFTPEQLVQALEAAARG